MEAGGVTLREWIQERFTSFDARIKSNHDAISDIRRAGGKRQEKIIKMESTLEDLVDDMAEVKKTLQRIMWGLFGAIAVGLMFVVAVGTLVIQAAH